VNEDRLLRIRQQLIVAFQPDELEIVDESHLHVGHKGAQEGKGHYRVKIVAKRFAGKTPLQRHRMVYDALGDLMQTDIHALRVSATSG
jgi:BolA protein